MDALSTAESFLPRKLTWRGGERTIRWRELFSRYRAADETSVTLPARRFPARLSINHRGSSRNRISKPPSAGLDRTEADMPLNPPRTSTVAHARAKYLTRKYLLSRDRAREPVEEFGYDADALEAAASSLGRDRREPGMTSRLRSCQGRHPHPLEPCTSIAKRRNKVLCGPFSRQVLLGPTPETNERLYQ
jgi:hypothetical protein